MTPVDKLVDHQLVGQRGAMHTLKSIEISGFRGSPRNIKIPINRHANFIIGRNGTGKTTLINLINALLTGNLAVLRSIPFLKAVLRFKDEDSNRVASVTVKAISEPQVFESISYEIRNFSTDEPKTFEIFRRQLRRVRMATTRTFAMVPENDYERDFQEQRRLAEALGSLIELSWLSLHRKDFQTEYDDEDPEEPTVYASDVDEKLTQVFREITTFFYQLDGQISQKLRDFQKQSFLSFLTSDSRTDAKVIAEINPEKERESLVSIFENFEVNRSQFSRELESQFKKFEEIRGMMSSGTQVTGLKKIAVLIDTLRLHHLVGRWQELQSEQKEVLSPKAHFLSVSSKLLYRKNLEATKSNALVIRDERSNNPIRLDELSSGEKQLLIFLGETLLQKRQPHIFLADEPELSLHIDWQESLVSNILELNPNAQVIFATHSPDIVSGFQDHIIKMEALTA